MPDKSSSITFDFGTISKPTSVPMEDVHLIIQPDMFADFSQAFINEIWRKNPLRAEQVDLTTDEVTDYIKFLVSQRVESISGDCKLWRQLKLLYIPAWIQYNLRLIGEVTLRERGLHIIPVFDEDVISYEEALLISNKIGSFENDVQMVKDAMPRNREGDEDVMSTALIAGYIRSFKELTHPMSSYVSAFMGMKLQEEIAMKIMYRYQYDDYAYIRNAIIAQKELYS